MSIPFEIKADFDKIGKWAKELGAKQIPFVTAKSLTDLAGEVNQEAVKSLRKYFTIRNTYVTKSFTRTMAKYREWPVCYSEAGSIFSPLGLQVMGGTKQDKSGNLLGIPKSRGELLRARPHQEDSIKNSFWVKRILANKKYIVVKGKSGPLVLMQSRVGNWKNKKKRSNAHRKRRTHHTGTRGWKRDSMYVLKKNVKIQPRFPFFDIAKKTIEERYEEVFKRNLNEALS